jgi:uncharacterized RDD family membrane protein YckC
MRSPTPEPTVPGDLLAGFTQRFWGWLIDGVIVTWLAGFVVGVFRTPSSVALAWLVPAAYYAYGYGKGRTLGCMVAGLRIVNTLDHGRPGYLRGLGRVAVQLGIALVALSFAAGGSRFGSQPLAAIPLVFGLACILGDYLWIIWDPKSQTWHHMIAGTYVVDQARSQKRDEDGAVVRQPASVHTHRYRKRPARSDRVREHEH